MKSTNATSAFIALQFLTTGLFYAKETGGFNVATIAEATQLSNDPVTIAFIKAHYLHPEKIVAVEVVPAATPENAHLNPHINGSIRARKTHHGRDGSRSYRFGDYRIELTVSRTSRRQGCGYRKTSTSTNFDLINHAAGEHSYLNSGGLRAALAAIIKREMKRHGLA